MAIAHSPASCKAKLVGCGIQKEWLKSNGPTRSQFLKRSRRLHESDESIQADLALLQAMAGMNFCKTRSPKNRMLSNSGGKSNGNPATDEDDVDGSPGEVRAFDKSKNDSFVEDSTLPRGSDNFSSNVENYGASDDVPAMSNSGSSIPIGGNFPVIMPPSPAMPSSMVARYLNSINNLVKKRQCTQRACIPKKENIN